MTRIVEEEDEENPKPLKLIGLEVNLKKIRSKMGRLQELQDTCNEMLQLISFDQKQKLTSISDIKKPGQDTQTQAEGKHHKKPNHLQDSKKCGKN